MIPSSWLRFSAPLLRLLPPRLAGSVYYRLFNARCAELPDQFDSAPLRFAPNVRMRLKVSDAAHGPMAFAGFYELDLTREIWRLARDCGGTLLDAGANYGYYSLLWCAARPANRAVAVEASPRNHEGLRHNIEANGFRGRIEIFSWAASDHEGEVSFDLGPPEQTGWGGVAQVPSEHTVTVPSHRLDQCFSGHTFTALKIDCEGADPLVIEGATGLLRTGMIKHVFYEENIGRMKGLGLVPGVAQRILESHGYHVAPLGKSGSSEFHATIKEDGRSKSGHKK